MLQIRVYVVKRVGVFGIIFETVCLCGLFQCAIATHAKILHHISEQELYLRISVVL